MKTSQDTCSEHRQYVGRFPMFDEEECVMFKFWSRQNLLCVLKIKRMSTTEALSCTCSNWLAGNWTAQNSWGKVCLHAAVLDPYQHKELATKAQQSKRLGSAGSAFTMGRNEG